MPDGRPDGGPSPGEPDAADPRGERRYWAFISYSRADAAAARRLHVFLETYRLPRRLVRVGPGRRALPARLAPVFRDRDELAGSSDLGASLTRALAASRSLIVLCSPAASRSRWVDQEVRTFAALGRGAAIFALIVADPDPGPDGDAASFPPSLRFAVEPDGSLGARTAEPLAADARPGKDGWSNACLKLVAGILDISYDDLRRREDVRRRRRHVRRAAGGAALMAAAALAYLGLADADLPVPGGDTLRLGLDRHGVTLFRPVEDAAAIARTAAAARTVLATRVREVIDSGFLTSGRVVSPWEIGQIAAAILADPASASDDARRAIRILDLIFGPTVPGGLEDVGPGLVGGTTRAEHVFWTVVALASALGRPDLADLELRASLERRLASVQAVAELYRPHPDGGWNPVPRQVDPGDHYIYTTGLALHMLLAVRAAGAGWRGSPEILDRMIAGTVGWLSGAFVDQPNRSGWRRSLSDDRAPDAGITLLINAALGRACAEIGTALPERIRDAALASQIALRRRGYDTADPDIRFDVQTIPAAGERRGLVTVTRMIWYPWAVSGVASWRRCAAREQLGPEIRRRLDRSLGHLVVGLSSDMLRDVTDPQRQIFVGAETYYGLASVP